MLILEDFHVRQLFLCIIYVIVMLYYLSIFGNGWSASIG